MWRTFAIEPGEGRAVAMTVALCFCLGVGYVTSQSAAYALFIEQFGSDHLAYALIAAAPVISLIAGVFIRLTGRVAAGHLLVGAVALMIATTAVLRVALAVSDAPWLRFALPIWDVGVNNLSNVVVGVVGGELFDVRQSKRLGGVIGSGRSAAVALGGLSVPLMLRVVGPSSMYTVACGSFVVAAVLLSRIVRTHAVVFGQPGPTPPPHPTTRDPEARRYVPAVLLGVLLSATTYLLLKYVFYAAAADRYADATVYASQLGIVLSLQGALTLVVSLFVSGHLLARFGVRPGLLALPVLLLLLFVPGAVGELLGGPAALLFFLSAVGAIMGGATVHALRSPSASVLYQPLPPVERVRASATADGVIEPVASGLAGVVLLVVVHYWDGPAPLALLLVATAAVLLIASSRIYLRYHAALRRALEKRWITGSSLELRDAASIATLREALRDEPTEAAVTLLELLERAGVDPRSLASDLLAHPSATVRAEGLRHLAAVDELSDHTLASVESLVHDTEPDVRERAVFLLARHGHARSADLVGAALDQHDVAARRGALTGGLSVEAPSAAACSRLQDLVASVAAEDRILATEVLGRLGPGRFAPQLVQLADDADPRVRTAALVAAAARPDRELLPGVVRGLLDPDDAGPAVRAAVAIGAPAIDAIAPHAHDRALPTQVRHRLVHVLGRIGGPEAAARLDAHVADAEPRISREALAALSALGHRRPAPMVDEHIRHEVTAAGERLAAIVALHAEPVAFELVLVCLRQEVQFHRDRILWWASFAYDAKGLRTAHQTLARNHRANLAFAIEAIDVALPHDLSRLVVPVMEIGDPAGERRALQSLQRETAGPPRSLAEQVARLVVDGDGWIAAAALFGASNAFPREAAREMAVKVVTSKSPLVREVARGILDADTGRNGLPMISTVERVAILRSVQAFATLETDVLGDLARLLHEVDLPAGEALFAKGDVGTSLYVVVDGLLDVHDEDLTIDRRGAREVIGELALLDAEPRMASVRALEDSRLLRLDQEPFYELLTDRHEVARALMHSVVNSLRARTSDLAVLQRRIDALEREHRSSDGG